MLLGAALLACAAVVIAVERRALIVLEPPVVKEVFGWLGMALALTGILYLIYIWWADRFRVSIGRLMVIVVMLAVLLGVVRTLQQREMARRARLPGMSSTVPR
jgi:hypothetical protein